MDAAIEHQRSAPKEGAVQRLLSLITLVGLGAGVWMFLSGGGLNDLAVPSPGQPGYGAGSTWNGTTPGYVPASTVPAPPPMATGTAAPPLADGPTIRIASFNIQKFGDSKAQDMRVMHTLAGIVRQFHVIAVQEITTQNEYHLQNFVQLVNSGGGATPRRYNYVLGPRLGNSSSKEQYAFIFDEERIILDRTSVFTVGDYEDNLLQREPLVASFATRLNPDVAFTFTLVNVHTTPEPASALDQELAALAEVYREVRRTGRGEDDIIMLGDFNASDKKMLAHPRLGRLPMVRPLVVGEGMYSNVRQNALYDNFLVHLPSTTEYQGRSGVYNFAQPLSLSPADAEQVSDHFPVWAEFSAYERDYTGGIASRGTTAR
jgi:endonuclease/exonuclease/phosphatase family metal-dependent hydrolase